MDDTLAPAAHVSPVSPRFDAWLEALLERHSRSLRFSEIRKGVQAISSVYVHKRQKIAEGVFDGAGKRAAFALFYGPLHYLVLHNVLRAVSMRTPSRIIDLGCGTASAGAAWCLRHREQPSQYLGVERNGWAAGEARWTLQTLGVPGRVQSSSLERYALCPSDRPGDATGSAGRSRKRVNLGVDRDTGVLLAYTVNELDAPARAQLFEQLMAAQGRGSAVIILEPIAKTPVPWWSEWERAFCAAGGRADTWSFTVDLPPVLRDLDRAAKLDHRTLKARTLIAP